LQTWDLFVGKALGCWVNALWSSPCFCIGMITPSGRILYRPVMTSVGLLNSGDPRVRFGPGTDSKAAFIEVRGPSGIVQTLTDLAADQALKIEGPPR
jgi:hypothetical protein